MAFRVLIIGGTGQVGATVVRALAAEPSCAEVVMVSRKAISLAADPRLRQVILDTAAAQFPAEVTKLAQSMVAQGDAVYGASCVGVGKGSRTWSEEALKALEIGVVGGFARGCRAGGITQFALLSAVGSTAKKQDPLCAGHGVKRRNGSRGRLQTPGNFPPRHHRRQCPYAELCCLVGASDSWSIRDD
jgi:nucleoside-diphosphate-sugar epimerase